jgi:ribosome-binding protein aMBF1 (putative translation factor)
MQYRVERITRARAIKGWTQADLAARIGKDASTVCKIEAGQIVGNPPTMKRIAEELGIPIEELIAEEEPEKATA